MLIWNHHLHVRISCLALCLITHFSRCNTTKTVVAWSRTFLGWEKSDAKTSDWFSDMEGHAKKRAERYCEIANAKVEQLYEVSTPCLDDHEFKKEELEIGWRFVKSLLSIRLEMLSCGTNWKTWHSLVCIQVGTSCHKNERSLWQALGSIDFSHSLREWSQTILPCG